MMTANRKTAGGLMVPAVIAALLMAAALTGCDARGNFVPRERVTGLPERAEAVGQDNGSLTSSFPTASEYQRVQRHPAAYTERAERGPRVELRAPVLER